MAEPYGEDSAGLGGLGDDLAAEPKEPLDEFGTEVSSAFPAEYWTP